MKDFFKIGDSINIELELQPNHGAAVIFKYPMIVETRADVYCKDHNISYDDICHKLPSGKIYWTRCPKCRDRVNKLDSFTEIEKMLTSYGHIYDYTARKWITGAEQDATQKEQPYKHKIGSYRVK